MNDIHLYYLLDVIFRNSSVKKLINQGLTYSQIAEMTNQAIKNELVTNSGNTLMLTNKGIDLLKQLEKKYKPVWIEKDIKNMIPKLDENSIYLPRQNELTFKIFT
jgi:hypothetical protein